MTTTTPPARIVAPDLPITPHPLWEAHLLFQEPHLPEGLGLLEDDEDDEQE